MRRTALVALLVLAVAVGCSSSSDSSEPSTTTVVRLTTTTEKPEPEVSDREIADQLEERLRPGLVSAFGEEKADCVVGVLRDGATGKISGDDLLKAYQTTCDLSATQVTGAIAAADVVAKGATPEQGTCVRDAFGKLTNEQAAGLGSSGTATLLEGCGLDPRALDG